MAKAKPVHEFREPFPEKQTQAHLQLLHANIYLDKLQLFCSPPVVYIHLEFNHPNENSSCREHCPFSWGHEAHAWEDIFSRQIVLSSVWEHKLLQAAFLCNNMWYLAMSCRGMLGRVILSQFCGYLPIHPSWRISLSFKGNWMGPWAPGQVLHVLLPMLLSNISFWMLLQNTGSVSRCKSIQETSTLIQRSKRHRYNMVFHWH